MKLTLHNEFVDFPESPNLCSWGALPAIAGELTKAWGVSAGTATTVGNIAKGAAIGGTLGQAGMSAKSASDNANAEAESYRIQGAINKAAVERQGAHVIAKNQARAAAGNVDPFSGSPLETELENAFNVGQQKALIDYDTRTKIRRSKYQGQQEGQHAFGSAIGSFGSILGKGYQLSTNP
jgi:hypothetical protein